MRFILPLLTAVEHFPLMSYLIILLISLLESLLFIGFLIPGTIFLVAVGFLSASGIFDMGSAILFSTVGAVLGDSVSFYLGGKSTGIFRRGNKILKTEYLEKGEAFFRQHGGKSIFFGRFVGSIRPIIPFIAGTAKMNKKNFFIFNILGALAWSLFYFLLGHFMAQVWQTVEDLSVVEAWSSKIGFFLFVLSSFFLIFFFMRQVILHYGKRLFAIITSIIR